MKLSDYVANFLVERHLSHIFLLPGGACMHLCDSIGKRPELDYICCLHEQACAFAAEAFAEYNNSIGVCLVTAGPGSTNALTGAACAWIESAPVVFISGQAKRADLLDRHGVRSFGPQEVDIVAMAKPVTKYAVRLMDPTRVRFELERSFYLATAGRKGPVWIDIPLDVQAAEIDPSFLTGFCPQTGGILDVLVGFEQSLAALRNARRPVIYAGNGVRTSGMADVFRKLVERLNVPVLLSWKAADLLPDDHPCFAGRPGAMGQRAANFTQQKADWMLILGARLDLPSIAFNLANFAPRAVKTVVDVDSAELRKFGDFVQVKIEGDLAHALPLIADRFAGIPAGHYSQWRELCAEWRAKYPVVQAGYWDQTDHVSTYVLIDMLSDEATTDDLVVPGSSGPCSDILMQGWRVKAGQRIMNAPGFGAMGTGLPATIGACLASGRRRVINVNGDGGFQLNIQELETVRRLQLPIKYFVLNNDGYASIVAMQRNHFKGRLVGSDPSSRLTLPDTGKIAEAYGIPAFTVRRHSDLRQAIRTVFQLTGPVVCVVRTSANEATAPKCTSEVRPDGSVVTKPMEDMWPFLDRADFDAMMAI